MDSPPRRGPPPPSEPPPPNISRSGRVPPPKGAPPGGARRARLPRQRQSKPPVVGSKASGGGKRSGGAGQRDEEQGINRRASYERPSQADDESPSDESSRGSFKDTADFDREEDAHHSPASSRRRRQGRSPSGSSVHDRREDSADESSLASLSLTRSPDRRWRRQADNHARGTGYDNRESPRSDSNCSNDDDNDVVDGTFRNNRGQKGGSSAPKEGSRRGRRDWDRSSESRPHRDARRSGSGSSSDRGRTDSTSGTDSEGGGGGREASRRYSSSDQHRIQQGKHKESKHYKERNESASDPESTDGRDSYTKGGDSPPHTRIRRRSSGDRSKRDDGGNDSKTTGRRRRGRDHDDSEAEGYGWSSNKTGWEAVDSASADNRSDQPRSPVLATRSDDAAQVQPTPARDTDAEDGATRTGNNNTIGAQRGTGRSSDHGKYIGGTPAARSGHSATDGAFGQPPGTTQTDSSAPAGNPPKPVVATVGKAIRGARWGEAIGVRSKVFDATTIPTTKVDLKKFVSTPLCSGPGTVLRCFIERDRSGTHKFSHVFSLYADLEDGSGRLLLAARKLLASKTAHYVICVRQDDLFRESGKRGGTSFLAKLRASSTDPTEYALYDRGDNPTSAATEAKGDSFSEAKSTSMRSPLRSKALGKAFGEEKQGEVELRQELGVIIYNFDKKEQRTGKRRMEVAIPQLHSTGDSFEPVLWQPSDAKESMKPNFGRIRYQGAQNFMQDDRLLIFHQRESRYDPLSSCLVDFRGRATAPSVKNFQLIKSPPEDNVKRARYFSEGAGKDDSESDDLPRPVYLQMGKVGKDCFNVDVEWPLSLLQAFAICLSRFDTNAHF